MKHIVTSVEKFEASTIIIVIKTCRHSRKPETNCASDFRKGITSFHAIVYAMTAELRLAPSLMAPGAFVDALSVEVVTAERGFACKYHPTKLNFHPIHLTTFEL